MEGEAARDEEKDRGLRQMRLAATGLLVLVAVVYAAAANFSSRSKNKTA